MPWWGWIVVGGLLLGAEMFAIDAEFYLIFLGIAALLVGTTELAGLHLPIWGQWLLFAVLSLTSMVTFRQKIYNKVRGGIPDMEDTMTGQRVQISDELAPGDECRVAHRGTKWTARNVGQTTIKSGSDASIKSVDGLILNVSNE
ncbi:MAG: NfeD family protein [Gammaproteobacteria bacterium]|nr:NfeD family protein [Gammaproteobacteria bacterium]MDH3768064.1 NfeD family protein [Gammaproteobacteria bacterium]